MLTLEGYRGVWLEPGETWSQHFVEVIYDHQVRGLSLDDFSKAVLSSVVAKIHREAGDKIGLLFVSDFLPLATLCWKSVNERYEGIAMRCTVDYDIVRDRIIARFDFRTLKP